MGTNDITLQPRLLINFDVVNVMPITFIGHHGEAVDDNEDQQQHYQLEAPLARYFLQ